MLGPLRAAARLFQRYIGWNKLGVVLSLAIIGVAFYVLFHMLRGIDVDEVMSAIKGTRSTTSSPPPSSSPAAILP